MLVKKYKVYCSDEAKFVSGWSEGEPTVCYNNNTHTIDDSKTAMVDIQTPVDVRIVQSSAGTDGDLYRLLPHSFVAQPNSTTVYDINIPIDCNLFAVHMSGRKENIGDIWSSCINRDTKIGFVLEPSTGNTIKITPDNLDGIRIGYHLSFDDGKTYNMVVSKTSDSVTIDGDVDVKAGDTAMMCYFMVYQKEILFVGMFTMGSSIIGSSRLPKESTKSIIYINKSVLPKRVEINLEITF